MITALLDRRHRRQRPPEVRVSRYAIAEAAVSSDGTRLAYATWDPSRPGGINVVDIDTGVDHSISAAFEDGYVWQDAEFSPAIRRSSATNSWRAPFSRSSACSTLMPSHSRS